MTTSVSDTAEHRGDGNTKTSPRSRHWCFTLFSEDEKFIDTALEMFDKCIFQLEEGEESKKKHYQGYGAFKNARTLFQVKKKFTKSGYNSVHLEVCRSIKHSKEYCSKYPTRLKGPWTKGFARPLKLISELRDWQQEIIDIIKKPADDRTIHWIWDIEGNKGKTALAKYIVANYNALYFSGKASDMKYLIASYFEESESNKDDLICLFDYTRSMENFISYQGIEEIKNGIFCSTKYECKMIQFNAPHIIIFANFEPETHKLSADRWSIKKI